MWRKVTNIRYAFDACAGHADNPYNVDADVYAAVEESNEDDADDVDDDDDTDEESGDDGDRSLHESA